jgi:2-desacetyl-2-hydroxyethyl bacteriochlorophyllide A dehydrogenase
LISLGLHAEGGLAELALVPELICVPVPDSLSPLEAVIAEPLAVAVRAVEHAPLTHGDDVAVLGGGTVGLMTAQVLQARGTSPLIIEPHEHRRRIAAGLGLRSVHPDDAATRTRGHVGSDATFECAGFPGAVHTALDLTRRGGSIMVLGVSESRINITPWDLIRDEQRIAGVLSHTKHDFETAMTLLARGAVRADGLVTDVVPLVRARENAFAALRDAPADHLKIVVTPNP